jgi:hypothetical protein
VGLLDDKVVFVYSSLVIPCILGMVAYVEWHSRRTPRLRWSPWVTRNVSLFCPSIAGLLAAYTAYFAKSLMAIAVRAQGALGSTSPHSASPHHSESPSLLFLQYDGEWDEFAHVEAWIYVFGVAFSIFNQLRYLNTGLRFYDSLQVFMPHI